MQQPLGCGQVLVDQVLVPGRCLVSTYLIGTWKYLAGTRYKHQVLGDQASRLHQLSCSQWWQHPSVVPIFEQETTRLEESCTAWWPPACFFLLLLWFSDMESGASISSVFWQSDLTSLEWFSKEQFLFGHWTLDGRLLFRGPKLLTPDLKLKNPR